MSYDKLRYLLSSQEWKQADEETLRLMLVGTSREKEGWISPADLGNYPSQDLTIISQLWNEYSQGCFGFSVQREIYRSLNPTNQFDPELWVTFCDFVGWRVNDKFLWYNELTFDLTVPLGHLPARGIGFVRGIGVFSLLSRSDW